MVSIPFLQMTQYSVTSELPGKRKNRKDFVKDISESSSEEDELDQESSEDENNDDVMSEDMGSDNNMEHGPENSQTKTGTKRYFKKAIVICCWNTALDINLLNLTDYDGVLIKIILRIILLDSRIVDVFWNTMPVVWSSQVKVKVTRWSSLKMS